MENEYERGFKDAVEACAKKVCLLCREGEAPRVWRTEHNLLSHKLTGKVDPNFIVFEACRAQGLWSLLDTTDHVAGVAISGGQGGYAHE